jgi:WD40 repeat protein
MTAKTKKILKITGIALTIIFVGFLIYYLFFKKTSAPVTTPEGVPIITGEEGGAGRTSRLVAITEEAVLGANLEKENKLVYVAWDGAINEINFDGGEKNKLGIVAAERIGEVLISKDAAKIVIKQTLSSGATKFLLFDSAEKSIKTLPGNIKSASFSPNGEQLVTNSFDVGGYKINVSKSDGSETKNITTTKIPDLVLDWYADNSVAFKTRPSGIAQGILYTLNLKTKKTSRVLGSLYGLMGTFSPSAEKLLYFQTDSSGKKTSLKSLNIAKKTEGSIGIKSIPDKCAWAGDNRTIFCGVIKTESSPVMPDDYYKGKIKTESEDIVKINLDIGKTQTLIGAPVDVYKPFLSKDETYLFFINKIDGRLYRLTL